MLRTPCHCNPLICLCCKADSNYKVRILSMSLTKYLRSSSGFVCALFSWIGNADQREVHNLWPSCLQLCIPDLDIHIKQACTQRHTHTHTRFLSFFPSLSHTQTSRSTHTRAQKIPFRGALRCISSASGFGGVTASGSCQPRWNNVRFWLIIDSLEMSALSILVCLAKEIAKQVALIIWRWRFFSRFLVSRRISGQTARITIFTQICSCLGFKHIVSGAGNKTSGTVLLNYLYCLGRALKKTMKGRTFGHSAAFSRCDKHVGPPAVVLP